MEMPDRAGTGHPILAAARHRQRYSTLADRFHVGSGSNCTASIAAATLPARPERPRCRGRMTIVAAIHSPNAIQQILNCLGLPSRAPPIAPAARTSSDQLEWS
jgi:hypothetical protein